VIDTDARTGAYRVTAEVRTFAGDDAFVPGAVPLAVVRAVAWFEADGRAITDGARIGELEANLAASQGDAYVPGPGAGYPPG
jgi:hypothetical protein